MRIHRWSWLFHPLGACAGIVDARHLYLIGDAVGGETALRRVAAGGSPAFGSIADEADLR
jgi:hypothetical protein